MLDSAFGHQRTIQRTIAADYQPFTSIAASQGKPLAALGTLDLLKVDTADFIRRDGMSAFCADRVECRPNLFEVDFLLPWASSDLGTGHDYNLIPAPRRWRN